MNIEDLNKSQKAISNKEIDWEKHYNYYEIELRDMYKTVSKLQNDSHYEMLKHKGKSYLKKDKIFCEIGFSAGLTLRYALNHFKKVYGLDISSKNVEFTSNELKNEGYKNYKLFYSDIMKFNKKFESMFDIISFIHGLEHFNEDDYPIMLNNIRKYLNPDGIFTGALPFKNRFNFRMCPACGKVYEIDGHVSSHDINSLRKVFTDNKFEILHLNNFNYHYIFKNESLLKIFYKSLLYYIKKQSKSQIEFIVKPINNI